MPERDKQIAVLEGDGVNLKCVGVQGVAEPAALHVVGGRLVVEKVKIGNVTVAGAEVLSQ